MIRTSGSRAWTGWKDHSSGRRGRRGARTTRRSPRRRRSRAGRWCAASSLRGGALSRMPTIVPLVDEDEIEADARVVHPEDVLAAVELEQHAVASRHRCPVHETPLRLRSSRAISTSTTSPSVLAPVASGKRTVAAGRGGKPRLRIVGHAAVAARFAAPERPATPPRAPWARPGRRRRSARAAPDVVVAMLAGDGSPGARRH